MLIFLSPSKTMNYTHKNNLSCKINASFPKRKETALQIIKYLKSKNLEQLKHILSCNDNKAKEALNFYKNFSLDGTIYSALAFTGTAYSKLAADTFTDEDWEFAQMHLRIFSALYGILKPTDLISQYRLDLINKLQWNNVSLKKFWKEKLKKDLLKEIQANSTILNLASAEYSALLPDNLKIITPEFITIKNGKESKSSVYSKQARGLFAGYVIRHKITDFKELTQELVDNYTFCKEKSTENSPVFIRHI